MTDHGLTSADLASIPTGTALHFTNWPGRASVLVTVIGPNGHVRLPDGTDLYAFPDELSRAPRPGLGN